MYLIKDRYRTERGKFSDFDDAKYFAIKLGQKLVGEMVDWYEEITDMRIEQRSEKNDYGENCCFSVKIGYYLYDDYSLYDSFDIVKSEG